MEKKNGIAVDMNTLVMDVEGKKIYSHELLEIWRKLNVLLYNGKKGNKPKFLDEERGLLIDISEMSKKEIDEIYKIVKFIADDRDYYSYKCNRLIKQILILFLCGILIGIALYGLFHELIK